MKKQRYITIALWAGILIMINLICTQIPVRLDITEGGQYTLSKATRTILKELDEPVSVKAYFSKNVPPDVAKTRNDFRELLVEYARRSSNMVNYEFVDPNSDERVEMQATDKGIQPVLLGIREKDQVKQQKAYLGAVISYKENQEVLPVIRPGAAMEYELSMAIKKLTQQKKPAIGIAEGHSEAGMGEMSQLMKQLSVLYTPQPVFLNDTEDIPGNINTLLFARPLDTLSVAQEAMLDSFLANGGNIILALNKVARFQVGSIQPVRTKFDEWLRKKGVYMSEKVVIDVQCGAVPAQGGFFNMIPVPYLPLISIFEKHPVTTGLESLYLEFPTAITYQQVDSNLRYTPLALSSRLSDTVEAPVFLDLQREWKEGDFKGKHFTVAALLEGKFNGGDKEGKILIVSDGDMIVNGPPPAPGSRQNNDLHGDNVNFISNAIDWMGDNTGLADLRTKGVSSRPILKLSESSKLLLKYSNLLLPILLAIGYGVYRSRRNKRIRTRRMQENMA
ncbi:MAG TPA: GldG family protein [Parasegetibacter sp.]